LRPIETCLDASHLSLTEHANGGLAGGSRLQPNHGIDRQGAFNRARSGKDLSTALDRLHFLDENSWIPVPDWARFFIRLGSLLSGAIAGNPRLVCAVSIPTRSHAAVFAAAGVVGQRVQINVPLDASGHLNRLRELPIGSTLFYRVDATKKVPCELRGFVMEDGVDYVLLEAGGGLRWYVPTANSLRIEPSSRHLRLPTNTGMRTVRANTDFLGLVLGQSRLDGFLRNSRLDTVVVGHEGLLRAEALSASFAILDKQGNPTMGKLQDMLRARCLLTTDASFRSDIVSSRRAHTMEPDRPWVVVFDGAAGFLRRYDLWLDTAWLVVLERTESQFEDAVNEVNRQQMVSASKELSIPNLPTPPPGAEFVLYQRNPG